MKIREKKLMNSIKEEIEEKKDKVDGEMNRINTKKVVISIIKNVNIIEAAEEATVEVVEITNLEVVTSIMVAEEVTIKTNKREQLEN